MPFLYLETNAHTLTSHAIVGKSLTELIDHNKENADWISTTLSGLYQHTQTYTT